MWMTECNKAMCRMHPKILINHWPLSLQMYPNSQLCLFVISWLSRWSYIDHHHHLYVAPLKAFILQILGFRDILNRRKKREKVNTKNCAKLRKRILLICKNENDDTERELQGSTIYTVIYFCYKLKNLSLTDCYRLQLS